MDKRFLDQCEKEQLHLSGKILPHGTVLIADAAGKITHVGANIAEFLGHPAERWLGRVAAEALGVTLQEVGGQPGATKLFPAALEGVQDRLDLMVCRAENGGVVLTVLPDRRDPGGPTTGAVPPPNSDDTDALYRRMVQEVAEQTGFQRVMFYRFREDGDGEVVAEARSSDAYGSYLGLRFPASDIPLIARNLYIRNGWRMIPDASAAPIDLVGLDESAADLTYCDLRSVSPVHQVYLANMGVRSSLSFPIMLGGNLVALIACHHTEARTLSLPRLEQVSQKLRAYCLTLASKQTQRRMNLLDGLTHRFSETRMILRGHDDLFSAWPEMGQWLMREFQAAGAALCFDDQVTGVGTLLEPEALQAVDAKFCTDQSDLVWSADSLHRQVPAFPPSEIAGVMGLRIGRPGGGSGAGGIRIYLTRSEHIHEVAWGGNPDKPVEFHDGAFGIAPRRSFEKWIEKRLGYCRAWNSEERLLMLKLRELLLQELRF